MTETSLAADTIERAYSAEQQDVIEPDANAGETQQMVQYYGLTRDPFAELGEVFLLTPKIEKLHRLLNYLTRFSHKLIVVTADAGVGKSCVAEQFLEQLSDDRDYCQINALADDTPVQMLREISEQIGLDVADTASLDALVAGIQEYVGELVEDGRTCLILIDDAELLGASVLETLYGLVQPANGNVSPLHLVLFGRPHLEDNLSLIDSLADERHHIFHYQLSRFSFKECCQYLQICFSRAGDQSRIPFSKTDYLRIHQNSRGIPLEIIAEARAVLADGVTRLVTNSPPPKWVLSAAVACSLIAAILVGALLWQQRTDQQLDASMSPDPTTKTLGTIERSGIPAAPEVVAAGEPVTGEEALEASGEASPEQLPPVLSIFQSAEPEAKLADATRMDPDVEEQVSEMESLEEMVLVTASDQDKQVAEADPLPLLAAPGLEDVLADQEEPVESESANLTASNGSGVEESSAVAVTQPQSPEPFLNARSEDGYAAYSASEQEILGRSGSAYTLQLLGARTEQQVQKFLAQHVGDESYSYFRTELKGAPWYVVIYGSYPDRAAAIAASASLPQSPGVGEPWVRRFSGIQKTLRDRAAPPQLSQQ